jgi:hypothetical protein
MPSILLVPGAPACHLRLGVRAPVADRLPVLAAPLASDWATFDRCVQYSQYLVAWLAGGWWLAGGSRWDGARTAAANCENAERFRSRFISAISFFVHAPIERRKKGCVPPNDILETPKTFAESRKVGDLHLAACRSCQPRVPCGAVRGLWLWLCDSVTL